MKVFRKKRPLWLEYQKSVFAESLQIAFENFSHKQIFDFMTFGVIFSEKHAIFSRARVVVSAQKSMFFQEISTKNATNQKLVFAISFLIGFENFWQKPIFYILTSDKDFSEKPSFFIIFNPQAGIVGICDLDI